MTTLALEAIVRVRLLFKNNEISRSNQSRMTNLFFKCVCSTKCYCSKFQAAFFTLLNVLQKTFINKLSTVILDCHYSLVICRQHVLQHVSIEQFILIQTLMLCVEIKKPHGSKKRKTMFYF